MLDVKLCFYIFVLFSPGCRKLVDAGGPSTNINQTNVYTNDVTAASVLTGIYTIMSASNFATTGGITAMSLFPSLSSDEMALFSGVENTSYIACYTNSLTANNTGPVDFWSNIYPIIFIANSAIEGLGSSSSLTPSVKNQLLGEAKFIRAFCFFYLTNLYGDVPLVTTSNYKENSVLPRTPQVQVYNKIIEDLKSAVTLLSDNYVDASIIRSSSERLRPNKWAAMALLARTCLYTEDWSDAELYSDSIIKNKSLYTLEDLNNVFLSKSQEAIWQIQPVNAGQNTQEAILFIIPTAGPNNTDNPIYLSSYLLSSFESGDKRRLVWVDSTISSGITYFYPYKYKVNSLGAPVSEYEMIMRLGEQYLIRAEAKTHNNDYNGALDDLNIIRHRAELSPLSANSSIAILAFIQHERQIELFSEWGHRWLDLKRTQTVNAVMGIGGVCAGKGGNWRAESQLYPIAIAEIKNNPFLTQNPSY